VTVQLPESETSPDSLKALRLPRLTCRITATIEKGHHELVLRRNRKALPENNVRSFSKFALTNSGWHEACLLNRLSWQRLHPTTIASTTKRLAFRAAVVAATAVTPLAAQNVSAVPGTPYNTTAVDASATGSSMAGMEVYVCLTTGCNTYTWGSLSPNYYGVQSNEFRIRVGNNEDTYPGDWRFDLYQDADLKSVTFSGFGGNTVFDRTRPSPGTPGSDVGNDGNLIDRCFGFLASNGCVSFDNNIVEYRNAVSLNGTTYGDLYESVFIDFTNVALYNGWRRSNANGGLDESYSEFYLRMDSDNARLTAVPEPATLALVLPGLAALGVAARRRRRV
jgi:hypothetical protein